MPPKKGEFPERPPTLAEALYGGKEIGTKPANHEQLLKDLNLGALIPKKDKEEKPKAPVGSEKTVATAKAVDAKPKTKGKVVKQIDAHIDTPLPADSPTTIGANYILPDQCEAVTNLQMDYILRRKTGLIQHILKSRVFSSLAFGLFSLVSYHKVGGYFNEHTFKNGTWNGVMSLWNNGYFTDDLFQLFFIILIMIAMFFTLLRYISSPFQEESVNVPKNFETYFNIKLDEYATLQNTEKNYNKLNSSDKAMVSFVKDNTFCIVYREAPVAFLVVSPTGADGKDLEIKGFGIRRVYIKSELLKDLIAMLFKRYIVGEKQRADSISVQLYSFETFDINIFKRAGFYRQKKESCGFLLSTFFGVTKDTYVFETDSIEF